MINNPTCKLFLSLSFVFSLTLTACGGGGEVEKVQWPQPIAFTDLLGGQTELFAGFSPFPKSSCQTCIGLYGVARSSTEVGALLGGYASNGKLFSELPIDYNSKMVVVLEDENSGLRYRNSISRIEETADAITITPFKCMVSDPYQNSYTARLGLLIPKTNKTIIVMPVQQSGKPPLPEYLPNGLGAC